MRRMAIAVAVAGALLGSASTAQAAHTEGPLQPGDYHETDVGGCTLGFLFQHDGLPHFSTAAHCVLDDEGNGGVGAAVRDIDGHPIGSVAYVADPPGPDAGPDVTEWDFAFVKVDSGRSVSPNMRGHATYPTGTTSATETRTGDRLQFSGWGIGFDLTAPTRERRFGFLSGDDSELWFGVAPDIFGDSGGPVAHVPTGKALGLVSRLCVGGCTSEGPSVQGMAAKAAAQGFPVALRHAE
jgi:hypothetical protein